MVSATGNITGGNVQGGNIVLTGNSINEVAAGGTITVNGAGANTNFAVSGLASNVFFVNASTNTASFGSSAQTTNAIVAFNTSTSILMPVGNTTQRPGTGVTGMLRFNTTNNSVEVYNNSAWANVGQQSFTVIADESFTGNGVQTAFTLVNSGQTTNSCIVSINGIVQIPTTAYSVSGTTLTFTEAPALGDAIDVRELTTTTSVTSIVGAGGGSITANATQAEIDVTGNLLVSGTISATGGVYGNIISYRIENGTSEANIGTASGNANITIGGTSNVAVFATTGLYVTGVASATGNITGGNVLTAGLVSATGTITGSQFNGSGAGLTSIPGANVTGTVANATYATSAGSATTAGTVTTNAQPNITSVGTLTVVNTSGAVSATGNITGGNITTAGTLSAAGTVISGTESVTGNITGGNINTAGTTGVLSVNSIIHTGTSGVGNIGASGAAFNTVFAQATTALYADLAEKYQADAQYAPGTVVDFGGEFEVTQSSRDMSTAVAGVVSTNPGFIMNEGLDGANVVAVAFTGRVPCRVTGYVHKGDLMVSNGDGTARSESSPAVGTVIGKALADFTDGGTGVIEVVVGRF